YGGRFTDSLRSTRNASREQRPLLGDGEGSCGILKDIPRRVSFSIHILFNVPSLSSTLQGRVLGQGTYAVVKEAQHIETGRLYAVKIINKKLMHGREDMVRNEITVLKRISQGNPNILTLHDYFETMNNLYLVTDLALGGELFDRICAKGNYYENDAAHLIKIITSAVAYLHNHGIVHR
ncbi:15176_t:CDS:2, partial [Dentiscutata erythropus]